MSQLHPLPSPFLFPLSFGWSTRRDIDLVDLPAYQEPARVTRHDRGSWTIQSTHGELIADLRGRLRKTTSAYDLPTVGRRCGRSRLGFRCGN